MRQRSGNNRGRNARDAELSWLDTANIHLRQFASLILALCASAPSAVLAADFPAAVLPQIYKEPPVAYNWTGFYVGGNIGAAWQGLSGTNFSDTIGSTFTAPTNVQFMGGGQIGVNYQLWNDVVVGAEAMFDWLPNTVNASITATAPDGTAASFGTINNRWLTTATGRLGYAWDRVLFYGKGGAAWVGPSSNPEVSIGGVPTTLTSNNNSDFGWTAGFGLEWAFRNNWSLRAEYNFIGLSTQKTFTVASGPTIFGGDIITYSYRNISIMTAGVNYKFGGR